MPSEACITSEEVLLLSKAAASPTMAPWGQDRFKLISALEMIRFFTGLVVIYVRDIATQTALLDVWLAEGEGHLPLASDSMVTVKDGVCESLRQMIESPEEVPVSRALRAKTERLLNRVETDDVITLSQAEVLLKELLNDIVLEFSSPYFLMVPAERRWLYEQRQPVFGPEVLARFPKAQYDIAAAGRCFALDEWTAAVFHLMRVLEKGLHALAAELQIPMAANIELENWKNIIDQIESKIRSLEQLPKSPMKSETLKAYSQMASNFWYFKEAWRNHVNHSRETYDEREALNIFNHVRIFMQELAARMTP